MTFILFFEKMVSCLIFYIFLLIHEKYDKCSFESRIDCDIFHCILLQINTLINYQYIPYYEFVSIVFPWNNWFWKIIIQSSS